MTEDDFLRQSLISLPPDNAAFSDLVSVFGSLIQPGFSRPKLTCGLSCAIQVLLLDPRKRIVAPFEMLTRT